MLGLVLAVGFVVRTSSPLAWTFILLHKAFWQKGGFVPLAGSALLVGLPVLAVLVAVDSVFYGRFTFSSYCFFKVNIAATNERGDDHVAIRISLKLCESFQ